MDKKYRIGYIWDIPVSKLEIYKIDTEEYSMGVRFIVSQCGTRWRSAWLSDNNKIGDEMPKSYDQETQDMPQHWMNLFEHYLANNLPPPTHTWVAPIPPKKYTLKDRFKDIVLE